MVHKRYKHVVIVYARLRLGARLGLGKLSPRTYLAMSNPLKHLREIIVRYAGVKEASMPTMIGSLKVARHSKSFCKSAQRIILSTMWTHG